MGGDGAESSSDTMEISDVIDDLFSNVSPKNLIDVTNVSASSSVADFNLLSQEFYRLRGERDELARTNTESSIALNRLEDRLNSLSAENAAVSSKLLRKKERLARIRDDHSREIENIRISEANERNLALQEQSARYDTRVNQLVSEMSALLEEAEEQKLLTRTNKALKDSANAQVTSLSKKLAESVTRESDLREQVRKLESRLKEFKVPYPLAEEGDSEKRENNSFMIPGQLLSLFRTSSSV